MTDEQPTFKVTDRRLFNADGSPRELSPEELAESKPISATTENIIQASSDTGEQSELKEAPEADAEPSEQELAEARDPASFVNFLMSIASNAASALGMMEHPVTHQREIDIELGKHWIDVLGMLQKKTQGNLSSQEKKMLEGLLADLRMQFVSLANATQKPRTFSGKDITGGK